MASVSVSPALQPPSPFESRSPPSSPSGAHRRQASRNPNAEPLPKFTFNATALEDTKPTQTDGETSDENNMDPSTRKISKPPPLPEFRFNPGANLPPERSPSPTHPVLQEMALNQQRVIRSARPAPLPAFSFAPNSASNQPSPSPTRSAFGDIPQSSGSGIGHRRRGSEFVGAINGGPQLVSSSPEKPEYRPPPVSGHPRGHTHRRSQAVSISDIETSDLIKANALSKARAGSTPTTPSEVAQQFAFPQQSPQPRQSTPHSSRSPPSSPRRRDSAPGVRPRVGFVDRVEMIPRPLSLISSETEGSCSTVRGGHSVSGSINSIAASPTPRTPATVTFSGGIGIEDQPERPKSADPTTLLFSGSARAEKAMSKINLPKRPLSASGSPAVTSSGSPPTKRKHFWFSNSPNQSPTPTPKAEKSDPLDAPPLVLDISQNAPRPKTSPERTASVKKRKYHTWTSGIFSRKAGKRTAKTKGKRTPTPPALIRRASDRINEIFDADDTIVIREPSPVAQRSRPRPKSAIPSIPSHSAPGLDSDVTSPVIDLDAALSPFGDEKSTHDTPSRTAAARIAKLHSSERRATMDAFGSFHKRSESAPTMQPVNRTSLNMHRIGSNSSLNEVFDEAEEDNFLADQTANTSDAGSPRKQPKTTESSPEAKDGRDSSLSPQSKPIDGLGLSVQGDSSDGIVIVDPEDDFAQTEQRSSKSTIEAPVYDDFAKRPATSPMPFAYPAPQSHYASSTEGRTTSASMISSPDPEHVSFDNLRGTNRYLGEPSPDFVLRASNEDLPSLSDSISSGAMPRISSSANTRSSVEQRSASVCVPATSRSSNPAWKRASLASLNRLIPGSANGSKLKFEAVPDAAVADDKTTKKTNRISRLMHFWRSKERGDD